MLPDGYKVVELAILEKDDEVELSGSEKRAFTVSVRLNRAIPEGAPAVVPFLVRDKELIQGLPLAVGTVGVLPGRDGGTNSTAFYMVCEDGDVAGRTCCPGDIYGNLEKWDRSSKERSTKIFVQYGEELREVLGITVGVVDAVESNRIRVTCPR
jgi:hypothetical protein